jgi:hypothetical protein
VRIAQEIRASREERVRSRSLQLLSLFAGARKEAGDDPRAVLVWQPIAKIARGLFPAEFAALDRSAGRPFPIDADVIQAAHARWTSDWLAWEGSHDAAYKLKAASVEHEGLEPSVARARLDVIEREKLELYQRRYEEYVRVAKALQALV